SSVEPRPGGPLRVVLRVDGAELASGTVPVSAALLFSANDCLDIGRAYGGAVSRAYVDRMPFAFDGRIDRVHIAYAVPPKPDSTCPTRPPTTSLPPETGGSVRRACARCSPSSCSR